MPTWLPVTLELMVPEELLQRHYPNGKLGGLMVDGRSPGALGQFVKLVVHVKKPLRDFEVQGQLAWARHKGSKTLHACFGIDFLPEDDSNRLRLLAFAKSEVSAHATRIEQRLQVKLPARVVHEGRVRRELLADLSAGGAFIRTWNPLPEGERLELLVRPPGSILALHLKGRVAWVRRAGDDPGMGIEFLDEDGGGSRAKLDRMLAQFAEEAASLPRPSTPTRRRAGR